MTHEEIEARKAEIAGLVDTATGEDLDKLLEEVRSLNEQDKELREAAEKAAEIRAKVAAEAAPVRTFDEKEERKESHMFSKESKEYREAWLKMLQGRELTTEERDAMTSANASAGYAVPTITADKIVENMVQIAPLLGKIDLMRIPGNVTICVEGTVNAAALHSEGAVVTPASDTLVKVSLGGYEMIKVLRISAKLATMSTDAFEAWIVSNLSRKLAELIENYVVNGTGSSQPKGIDAAETWTSGTNAVDLAADGPTAAELLTAIGLLNPAYLQNASWLMNPQNFYAKIYGLRDEKNPAVITGENGNFRVFGFPVVFSSKVTSGDYFFGDLFEAVKGNLAEDITIESDRSSGFLANSVDYRGTCIFDCTTIAGRMIKAANTL